jgi:glycine cleavage system aminomethyltransferase T
VAGDRRKLRTGPLTEIYRSGVREMGEYHGWEMPAVFSTVEREFDAAIRRAALVDHSSVGRIEVYGADRLDFLHRLSTNELLKVRSKTVVGTIFTNEKGRIIDYATVAVKGDRIRFLVTPADESFRP